MISEAIAKMIDFYQGNLHDINHFLKVYAYAKTIGELENLDRDVQERLELAAVVHDIACPLCREGDGRACDLGGSASSHAVGADRSILARAGSSDSSGG